MNRACSSWLLTLSLTLLFACKDRSSLEDRFLAEQADSATPAASASAPNPKASVAPTAKPTASVDRRIKAPRPVPIGSSGPIQPTDPPEKQMMAIQYTLAMLAPLPGGPRPDRQAIDAVAKKMSAGPVQAYADKGHRLLVVDTPSGCTADKPTRLVVGRGGLSLEQLYDLGVTVVKCHDRKWACHQSTRDPKDVLCHAAPRRGRRRFR